jgi:hypothetical protein
MTVNSLRFATIALYHKLKDMRAIFDKINIESIQFESGSREVHVNCKISQGNQTFRSELLVDHTDLNKLMGRIQQLSEQTEVMISFDKFDMQNGHEYYSLEMQKTEFADLWIENVEFGNAFRQIRA